MKKKIILIITISLLMVSAVYSYLQYSNFQEVTSLFLKNQVYSYENNIRMAQEGINTALESGHMEPKLHQKVRFNIQETSRAASNLAHYYKYPSNKDDAVLERIVMEFEDTGILVVKDDYPYIFTDEERESLLRLQEKLLSQISYLDSIDDRENIAWEQFVKGLLEVIGT